jgi:hypothetical protein
MNDGDWAEGEAKWWWKYLIPQKLHAAAKATEKEQRATLHKDAAQTLEGAVAAHPSYHRCACKYVQFVTMWALTLAAVAFNGYAQQPQPTGGGVHGSVFVRAPSKAGETPVERGFGSPIYLPDFELFLENVKTGAQSKPLKTDLFGRFAFSMQEPGTYRIRWPEQAGWEEGVYPDNIVIVHNTQYPGPIEIRPQKGVGVLIGQVKLEDGSSPWFNDAFFGINKTAEITILDSSEKQVAQPVRCNAVGQFAAAGLPMTNLKVRATSEGASVEQGVPVTDIFFGNPISPVNLTFKNHRPQILAVVARLNQKAVRTVAPGDTVTASVQARDLDNNSLKVEWRIQDGMGKLTPSGASADWTFPSKPGCYTVYVMVSDAHGGYATSSLSVLVGSTDEVFSGKVVEQTGTPIAGATLSVNGKTQLSDNNGAFLLRVPRSERYVMNISKPGYALLSRLFDVGSTGQVWRLIRTQVTTVDPSKDIQVVDNRPELKEKRQRGVRFSIPANSLVDSDGKPPTGLINASVATLDIAQGEAPGDWGAIEGGKEVNLVSYGAVFVEFTDSAGKKYNLAPQKAAEIALPAPTSLVAVAPQAAQFWSYDTNDGFWKPFGTATFDKVKSTYAGKIDHFSTINTDLSKSTASCLKVVLDSTIPAGLKLRITDPTGGAVFGQAFEFAMDQSINAVYRLPPNANVKLEVIDSTGKTIPNVAVEETPGSPLPNNIVNSGPALPPGHTLWPPFPYDDCKAVTLKLVIPTQASFLVFGGEAQSGTGSGPGADAYYNAVDPPDPSKNPPKGRRTTLGDWWTTNGFDSQTGAASGEVRTSYLNNNDLGSGRDMHVLQHSDGTVSAYVTNYVDVTGGKAQFNQNAAYADAAATQDPQRRNATVCMEYSPVEGQDQNKRVVKFFVFAGNGFGTNATRQQGADLDGNGVKFVPNLCLNCHGGIYSNPVSPTFTDLVNMRASFREFDLATFKYPAFHDTPNASEKDHFKQQNVVIKSSTAVDTATTQAIKDLIDGWYASGSTDQDITWNPAGWNGAPQQELYHTLVEKSCRTCHVAFDSDDSNFGLNWTNFDQFRNKYTAIQGYVCGSSKFMPHAKVTFNNFWLSTNPSRPAALRDFIAPQWTQIGNCPP